MRADSGSKDGDGVTPDGALGEASIMHWLPEEAYNLQSISKYNLTTQKGGTVESHGRL